MQKVILALCLAFSHLSALNPKPVSSILCPCDKYTLINSVDFHPTENQFCVTYTHASQVRLYKVNADGGTEEIQTLANPEALLSAPQHAVFSQDGNRLIVANWINQTVTIYQRNKKNRFATSPVAVITLAKEFDRLRPHGIAISPCGKFLAIAFGASADFGRAIALFAFSEDGLSISLSSLLEEKNFRGIPKGITFTPDGSCLLVTFADLNSFRIYAIDQDQQLVRRPRQVIQGPWTGMFRPEDIKITRDGKYCAVTNSEIDTITFYPFDSIANKLISSTPVFTMKNPDADICFPHGIAFSSDGIYMAATEFGPTTITGNGGIVIADQPPQQAKVTLFTLYDEP